MLRVFGSRPAVSLHLENAALRSGAEVRGAVLVQSESEREVDRGLVYLRCEEECEYRVRRRSSSRQGGDSVQTEREHTRLVDLEAPFLDKTVLIPGQAAEYGFTLQLPQGAPPTYRGDILRLRWSVYARLDLDRALDSTAEEELTVYQPPEGPYPQPRYDSDVERHSECEISLSLDGTSYRTGDQVGGTLRVEPRESFKAQEIRLELERVEYVPRHEGNTRSGRMAGIQLAPETELAQGTPLDLPFRLDVPPDLCPSTFTQHAAVYWELVAVVARSWRGDLHLRKGVHVHTLPPGE